jgi:tetratricopeptide (TPR) repeat protein
MRGSLHALSAAAALVLLPAAPLATAAEPALEKPARTLTAPRRTPQIRRAVFQRFDAVQQAADAGEHDRALGMLDALAKDFDAGRSLNSYERANLFYFRGFIEDARGQTDAAARAYLQVLKQPGLPAIMEANTRYSLAQLQVSLGQWAQASAMLRAWFAISEDPLPEAHALLARSLHGQERHRDALTELDAAIAEAKRRNLAPQEGWYLLMRASAYAAGDLARTASALETLAGTWPRKEYFLQLAAVYGELGQAGKRVAAMEAPWLAGWLMEEQDLLGLAALYLENGLPARAAALLERELAAGRVSTTPDHLALLATAWENAREPALAIPKLDAAARLGGDGSLWLRLAALQLANGAPAGAVTSARAALMPGVKNPQGARVMLGRALYAAGRLQEAREAFALAGKEPADSAVAAKWLRFLEGEIAREEML